MVWVCIKTVFKIASKKPKFIIQASRLCLIEPATSIVYTGKAAKHLFGHCIPIDIEFVIYYNNPKITVLLFNEEIVITHITTIFKKVWQWVVGGIKSFVLAIIITRQRW